MDERKAKYSEEASTLENELEIYLRNIENEAKTNAILVDLLDVDAIRKQFPKFQKMCGKI